MIEYDTLYYYGSIDASFSTSLASLLTPSTSSKLALFASSSSLWIINSGASSPMTETSSLLSSYQPMTSHPLIAIVGSRPYLIQGCGTTRVPLSLSLQQIFHVPHFLVNSCTSLYSYLLSFFIENSKIYTPDRGLI